MVRRNVGYADCLQPTWQKLARLVVGAGFPAVTLYYNNDIRASLLLFMMVYAVQANHGRTGAYMQEIVSIAVEIYEVK